MSLPPNNSSTDATSRVIVSNGGSGNHTENDEEMLDEEEKQVIYKMLFDLDSDSDDDDFRAPESAPSITRETSEATNTEEEGEDDFAVEPITQQEISDLQLDSFFSEFSDDDLDPDYAPTNEQNSEVAEEFVIDRVPQKEVAFLLQELKETETFSPNGKRQRKKPVRPITPPPPIPFILPQPIFSDGDLDRLQSQIKTHYQLMLQTYSLSYLDTHVCQSETTSSTQSHSAAAPALNDHFTQPTLLATPFQSFLPTLPILDTSFLNPALPQQSIGQQIPVQSDKHPTNTAKQPKSKGKKKKHQKEDDLDMKLVDNRPVPQKIASLIFQLHEKANHNHLIKSNYIQYLWKHGDGSLETTASNESEPPIITSTLMSAIPPHVQTAATYFMNVIQKSEAEYLRSRLQEVYNNYNALWTDQDILPNFADGYPYKEKSKLGRLNFTKPEDKLLVLGLERFGIGAWKDIRNDLLPTKTIAQLQHRYKNMSAGKAPLEDNPIKEFYLSRRKPMTDEEWKKLDAGVQKYGWKAQKVWDDIAKDYFPYSRDASFLRDQWLQKYEPERYQQEQEKKKDAAKKRKRSDSDSSDVANVHPTKKTPYVATSSMNSDGTSTTPTTDNIHTIDHIQKQSNTHNPATTTAAAIPTDNASIPGQYDNIFVSLPSLSSLIGRQDSVQRSSGNSDCQRWEVEDVDDSGDEEMDRKYPIPDNIMIINGQKIVWTLEDDRKILTASLKQQGGKERIWLELVQQNAIPNKDVHMITKRYEWLIKRLQGNL